MIDTLSPPEGALSEDEALAHIRKMAALGELASGITHDFRNVLQTVISSLELIGNRSADPDEVKRLVARALTASERGIGLTRRILSYSRNDVAPRRPVDLLPCVADVTETLSRTVGARMKVELEIATEALWPTAIDTTEFELALINLGINARDAMPGGGSIKLAARNVTIPDGERRLGAERRTDARDRSDRRGPRLALPGGDYVAVSVADTGQGMPPEVLAQATRPFFTTKPAGKGTGLGLPMVNGFARQHGGQLRLMSAPGRGTTVELWLPRAG